MIKKRLSTKQKGIFFVLFLISILLLTLYFQNQTSNKNYLIQISKNYKKNFDSHYKFLEKRLLDFYETQTEYIQNDTYNKKKLLEKEKFLKDFNIVNIQDKQSTSIYFEKLQKDKSFIDIQIIDEIIFYKIIVPIKNKNEIAAYAEYILDSRIILESIKNFDGSDGILYVEDNKLPDIFLEEYQKNEFFKEIIRRCEDNQESPIVKYLSKTYLKKEFHLQNFKGNNISNAIFFLDITEDVTAYNETVKKSLISSIFLFILAAIAVFYYFSYLIHKIEKNENDLKDINKNLEQLIDKETQDRLNIVQEAQQEKLKSEQLLIQQSKLALLGEMIGNIAHQWRQPLMQLSGILMYIDAFNEKGKLTEDKLLKKVKEGNLTIDFMSKTIEDFRNYYQPEKQKEVFLVKESIDGALFIINSAIKNANIEIKIYYQEENIILTSFKNEFSQALLNIITNAKDILVQREVQNPQIDINVTQYKNTIMITIEDNAGGIENTIIDKIFDPYFTTKHKSQGTGIGLYMTKMIIENNMNGTINVSNSKLGGIFSITLPIDQTQLKS